MKDSIELGSRQINYLLVKVYTINNSVVMTQFVMDIELTNEIYNKQYK